MFGQIPNWVACEGGPHILVPFEIAHRWDANATSSPGATTKPESRPPTNYDRACAIALQHEIGLIEFDQFAGVVVGDEVPMSTWLARPNGIGGDVVVALEWGFDWKEVNLDASVRLLSDSEFMPNGLTLRVGTHGLVQFAASESPPPWSFGHIDCPIAPGNYSIATTHCKFGDYIVVRIHRFLAAE